MDIDTFEALQDLHNNKWTDLLLSNLFTSTILTVLTKKERVVLGQKVQLYEEGVPEDRANEIIARLLNTKVSSVTRLIYNIKSKYRHGMDVRVDNKLHPEIYRQKMRKVRKGYAN